MEAANILRNAGNTVKLILERSRTYYLEEEEEEEEEVEKREERREEKGEGISRTDEGISSSSQVVADQTGQVEDSSEEEGEEEGEGEESMVGGEGDKTEESTEKEIIVRMHYVHVHVLVQYTCIL